MAGCKGAAGTESRGGDHEIEVEAFPQADSLPANRGMQPDGGAD